MPAVPPVGETLPPLSRRLRRLVEDLLLNVDRVVEQVLVDMRQNITDYAEVQSKETRASVQESVHFNARLWYEALISGQALSTEKLEHAASYARRRVHQGISLAGLLRAYRVGSGRIWTSLLDAAGDDASLYPELLQKVSPYLLYHFDVIAQAVSQAYIAEQFGRELWRDRLRRELCDILFSRPQETDAFQRYAQALGLDASAPRAALALRLGHLSQPLTELEQVPPELVRHTYSTLGVAEADLLQCLRYGHWVIWQPLPHGHSLFTDCLSLTETARRLTAQQTVIEGIGIGLPASGPQGWADSAGQAIKAAVTGSRMQSETRVHAYADFVLEDAVTSTPASQRYFEAMIEQLATEPVLLETLRVFFERGPHRKVVAGHLNIHPNTLNYRLQRIETLLQADLNQPGWRARLHIALRLARG